MSGRRAPLFLERGSYRRRRLTDAARVLPLVGVFLALVPLLWGRGGDGTAPATSAGGMVYLFTAWAGLIFCAWLLARPLSRQGAPDADGAPQEPGSGKEPRP